MALRTLGAGRMRLCFGMLHILTALTTTTTTTATTKTTAATTTTTTTTASAAAAVVVPIVTRMTLLPRGSRNRTAQITLRRTILMGTQLICTTHSTKATTAATTTTATTVAIITTPT